jgi:outer membrane protein OmpA-like peptidoglycan-associated protein
MRARTVFPSFGAPLLLAFLATVAGAGCASVPPPELESARSAYARVSVGPAATYAPADLHIAQEALSAAEQSFQREGDTQGTRDDAYTAQRKAEIAEVRAKTAAANLLRDQDVAATQAAKDQQVRITSAQLATANQALQDEKTAREKAERRAARIASDLAQIASVRQEQRGMIITLSGSVLFASAKSELLPAAQAKLSQVADALTQGDPDSKIRVEGHTDSQGAATFNQELSQRRADAVRTYLVSRGIAGDRVTAEGFGPSRPVASNDNAEGRADNRRVEIVVEPPAAAPR